MHRHETVSRGRDFSRHQNRRKAVGKHEPPDQVKTTVIANLHVLDSILREGGQDPRLAA